MTAANAYEVANETKYVDIVERAERTQDYYDDILSVLIGCAALMGERTFMHLVPSRKFDAAQIARMLRIDDYMVFRIGRLLIVQW